MPEMGSERGRNRNAKLRSRSSTSKIMRNTVVSEQIGEFNAIDGGGSKNYIPL
jgi:hypothetical protein